MVNLCQKKCFLKIPAFLSCKWGNSAENKLLQCPGFTYSQDKKSGNFKMDVSRDCHEKFDLSSKIYSLKKIHNVGPVVTKLGQND